MKTICYSNRVWLHQYNCTSTFFVKKETWLRSIFVKNEKYKYSIFRFKLSTVWATEGSIPWLIYFARRGACKRYALPGHPEAIACDGATFLKYINIFLFILKIKMLYFIRSIAIVLKLYSMHPSTTLQAWMCLKKKVEIS